MYLYTGLYPCLLDWLIRVSFAEIIKRFVFLGFTRISGTNLEDGPGDEPPMYLYITEAVKQGKLTEQAVRESVKPLFYTRMRLGLFDPPGTNPYASLDPAVEVQSEEHRKLSLISAMRSFVLLKNDGLLPLVSGKKFLRIAVRDLHLLNVQHAKRRVIIANRVFKKNYL